jgi:hypothetical protein
MVLKGGAAINGVVITGAVTPGVLFLLHAGAQASKKNKAAVLRMIFILLF